MRAFLVGSGLLAIVIALSGPPAYAQNTDPATAAAEAKALKEAASDRVEAAKKEAELQNLPTTIKLQNEQAEATALGAIAATRKTTAESETAAIAAEQANVKAKFGSIAANTVKPADASLAAGAGQMEGSVAAAGQVADLGKLIADGVKHTCLSHSMGTLVITGTKAPTYANLRQFDLRREVVEKLFDSAELLPIPEPKKAGGGQTTASNPLGVGITGVGALLGSAANLASFFQANFAFGKAEIAGSDNDLLAMAVVANLEGCNASVPGRWTSASDSGIFDKIAALTKRRMASALKLAKAQAGLKPIDDQLAKSKTDDEKADLQAQAEPFRSAVAAHELAEKAFDDFLTGLGTVDNGVPLITKVIEETYISGKVTGGALILLANLNTVGASVFTKQSLWSFGANPLFVNGGAVASYMLVDKNGVILKAGALSGVSGYKRQKMVKSGN